MFTSFLLGVGAAGAVNDLVSDLGLAAAYESSDNLGGATAASIKLTIKRNGTYEITGGADDSLSGSPLTGNWVNTPYSNVGDNYQVRFTTANQLGSPTITNDTGGAFTTISTDLSIELLASGGSTRSADFITELRQIGVIPTQLTETANFEAIGG